MNQSNDGGSTHRGPQEDPMKKEIEFVRSINTGNIFLIGHTDTKTTIIVTLNGILLGLLSDTYKGWPPELQYFFIPVVLLLAASAFSGLVGIFPRTYRNIRYKDSLIYHEVTVGKEPYKAFRERLVFRFRRLWTRKTHDKLAFDNFHDRIVKVDSNDVLEQEVLSAYMLSVKLNHMVVWVRLSFLLLILGITLLAVILSVLSQTASSSPVN